ncbi:hypothetical protein DFH07DRAFT_945243 [Mycena maculata]|uniref:Uncharacterized protein n=1 Tax=Mycena maculata TaxID=230809 RepID=A0AAD7MTB3_9AGAR|nr:hypothetical protein DFH07DRAFT_945243 [Mycena maculata]
MPVAVHKIDVNSPLIQYEGNWIRGGSSGDPRGPDADPEQVKSTGTLLEQFVRTRDQSSMTNPEQFQIDRFNKTDLVDGPHQLKIFNFASSRTTFDIDFSNWTSNINSLVNARFQDDHPAFVYDPPGAWSTNMTNLQGFDDGNGQ